MDMLIKAGFLYALQITMNSTPAQQRTGILMLLDMGGFSFSHARECSYSNVTKMANCIIFGSPFRINSAFLVNSPYIFEKCWSVIKFAIPEFYRNFVSVSFHSYTLQLWIPFANYKLFLQITVTTNDFTKLHTLVNPDQLPESLGGFLPEEQGWEEGVEDGIREGKGTEVVHELMAAVERYQEQEKQTETKSCGLL